MYHSNKTYNTCDTHNILNDKNFQIIVELSEILDESGEVGEMELEIFKFRIKSLKTYEKELILVK